MRQMTVVVNSKHGFDNFSVTVKDGEETIFDEDYEKGNTVTYDKRNVNKYKPYVTDVLCQLKEQFHVDKLTLERGEGCYHDGSYYKDLMIFDRDYCMVNSELAHIKEKFPVKSVAFVEQDTRYGTFDILVYDGDMETFMADDGEINGNVPERVSPVARFRSWNSFSEVLQELQKNIPMSDISTHVPSPNEGPCSAILKMGINADELENEVLMDYTMRQMIFRTESQKYPDMKMTVTFNCGINADGFNVIITANGKQVLDHDYNYGYNVTYNKDWGSERTPYVTDVLQDLIDKYHISDFTVKAGRNAFMGTDVRPETVENFKTEYCSGLKLSEKADAKPKEPVFLTKDILDQLEKEAGVNNGQQM